MEFKVDDEFIYDNVKYRITECGERRVATCVIADDFLSYSHYFSYKVLKDECVFLPKLEEPPTPQLYPLSANTAGIIEILNDLYKEDHKQSLQFYKNYLDNGFMETGVVAQMGPNKGLPSITESIQQTQAGINQILSKTIDTCDHDRVTYDSGWSRYDYCTKCDIKFKEVL